MNVTQTIAAGLPAINPELLAAAPERVHEKAAGVFWAVVLGTIAGTLLVGGGVMVYFFAKQAIETKAPLSLTLMATLFFPLVPGFVVAIFAAIRLDPDAGGALTQIASVVGAFRKAIRGNGNGSPPPPAEAA